MQYITARFKASCSPGDCVALTCSFYRQAYRHDEAIHLSLRTMPPSRSNLLTLLECDGISSLFFATSGDAGLGGDVISSCGKWQLGRFCQGQLGGLFLVRNSRCAAAARVYWSGENHSCRRRVQWHQICAKACWKGSRGSAERFREDKDLYIRS
jgi:hypothetical protein